MYPVWELAVVASRAFATSPSALYSILRDIIGKHRFGSQRGHAMILCRMHRRTLDKRQP